MVVDLYFSAVSCPFMHFPLFLCWVRVSLSLTSHRRSPQPRNDTHQGRHVLGIETIGDEDNLHMGRALNLDGYLLREGSVARHGIDKEVLYPLRVRAAHSVLAWRDGQTTQRPQFSLCASTRCTRGGPTALPSQLRSGALPQNAAQLNALAATAE